MALAWEQVVIDSADPSALANWWARALGWTVVTDEPYEVEVQPAPGVTPGLIFLPVPEAKAGKNRLHLDFRPTGTDADQRAEVARLIGLGARRMVRPTRRRGSSWPTPRATNSASCAPTEPPTQPSAQRPVPLHHLDRRRR
jgi:hypothetical protein